MSLNDPMESLSKQVKDVGGGLEAKDKDHVVIKGVVPVAAEQVPVLSTDRDVAKGILEVQFCQEHALPEPCKFGNCAFKRLVGNVPFAVRDAVIDRATGWPGQMVDDPELAGLAFARDRPKWGTGKEPIGGRANGP